MIKSTMLGIIPAGGMAKRLQPIDHSKEMTLVNGYPIIYYLIRRLSTVCDRIVVVSRRNKQDLNNYCRKQGLSLIFQKRPELSGAIVDGLGVVKKGECAFWGLPDTVWKPKNAFSIIAKKSGNVLGLFPVGQPENFTVIESRRGYVYRIYGKTPNPPSNMIWGVGKMDYKFLPKIISSVEKSGGTNSCEEIIKAAPFKTVSFSFGKYVDIGIPDVFTRIDFFVKNMNLEK